MMKKLPHDVYVKAAQNWDTYYGFKKPNNQYATFSADLFKFCGCTRPNWWRNENGLSDGFVAVPEQSIEKFYMLASPHFRTLLKAYRIRQKNNYAQKENKHAQTRHGGRGNKPRQKIQE